MAVITSFPALRYNPQHVGDLSQVVAPPYDVIDSALQDELYKQHPANVVRLILNRSEPSDESPDARYQRAANFLKEWQRQGVLQRDAAPGIYLYQQEFSHQGRTLTRSGFLARMRLEELGKGTVFPHEETHAAAKSDRLKLMTACRANLSPIFGLYPDQNCQVDTHLRKAVGGLQPATATDHLGVVHRLWCITDSSVVQATAKTMAEKPIFIADGHHRYETALNYLQALQASAPLPDDHPARFVLMMHVGMNDPGMIVLPTHRLFRGVPPIESSELRSRLSECFETRVAGEGTDLADVIWTEMERTARQETIAFYTHADSRWLMATLTPAGRDRMSELASDHGPDWRSLGVSLLHRLVMDHLLGFSNLPKPMYVHSVEEVVTLLDQGDTVGRDATGQEGTGERFSLAALVMPATLAHVRDISRTGERMPAKSTYFYPKLLSGLVFHDLSRPD